MNKKVLKRRIDFLTSPLINYVTRANYRHTTLYAKYYENVKVEKNTIFYESRDGNSMTDSPYAMFKYMLNHPKFKNFEHRWSVSDPKAIAYMIDKYDHYPNVKFIRRNTKDYVYALATSEYLINNSTFLPYFMPKEEQIYINTWHGTPLKLMGYDIPGSPALSQNVIRNFLNTTYLLSPNAHTSRIFTESYKLRGLYTGQIIEEGYPRIDLTFNTDPKEYNTFLTSLGLEIDQEKKNILYAPTWKGTNVSKANNDVLQIIADLNFLKEEIGQNYNLLIKVHPFLYNQALEYDELKSYLIPDFVDPNELLSTTDILITDYSSIFFDFLVTGRPILFYTWDADAYSEERGQYIQTKDLPGPPLYTVVELAEAIKNIDSFSESFESNYKNMQQTYTRYDDGHVTERVVDYIFGLSSNPLNVIDHLDESKEKILIYPGGMRNNGITSSFINLMNNIDFDKYDVSCFTATPGSQEVLNNIEKVDKRVRWLFKPGLPLYTLFETYEDKFIHNRGKRGALGEKLYPEEAYRREHRRLFGKSEFDYVIDFSGYSLYWAKYLVAADAKKKICYMHNDLLSDSERTINGRRPHRINLRGLFSIYNQFDKLVSVSKGTMELNRENLHQYADYDKFDYIMNSINPEKILQSDRSTESKDQEEKTNDIQYKVEDYKSRARILEIHKYPVWNILPGTEGAKATPLDPQISLNTEIILSRKATHDNKVYYKFSYNYRVMGWIDAEAIQLLPDIAKNVKTVNKIAQITRTYGHTLWSKPYKVGEATRVSRVSDFKNLFVNIDQEAETEKGVYSRISINHVPIGWLDNNAMTVIDRCTLTPDQSGYSQWKIKFFRGLLLAFNKVRYRKVIKNLKNRTLDEVYVRYPVYAKITHPDNYTIWNKPYPNIWYKEVAMAKDYEGETVVLKMVSRTIKGTFYQFAVNKKIIGWLDSRAFNLIKEPTIIEEVEVSKKVLVRRDASETLWSEPYGLKEATPVMVDTQELYGEVVSVDREATTQQGVFSHIIKDGKPLGWINSKALEANDDLGVQGSNGFTPYPDEDNVNFVNMGRLSPEKGQDNLIRAFAEFHKNHLNSRLYILGSGPLKDDLEELIAELDVNNAVQLVGQLDNPFPFMKRCDCFVLSSHYEGQPMVLLEALTLGMKIIATDIVANRTVLEDGHYGLLVENSVEGLEKGLEAMADSKPSIPSPDFDYKEYNKDAMDSFYLQLQ